MYGTLQNNYLWRKQLRTNKTKTSTMKNGPRISADAQDRIEPPTIPLIKSELEEHIEKN